KPLPEELLAENTDDVEAGAPNLIKQIENIRLHGVSPVVAINSFPTDHASEHETIRRIAEAAGARVAVANHFSEGGDGAIDLAQAVVEACEEPSTFTPLYGLEMSLHDKIDKVAREVYGADGIDPSPEAAKQLAAYTEAGFGNLPVCIAKTHLSLSSDASLLGAPTGWRMPVREVRVSAGAGFIYPIAGAMRTMPGLSRHPAAHAIDLDAEGEIVNLS
ncbi:MAG: formate--tetrahydrofolate ligase, partial [Ornithinimicrobium sp.]